MNIENLKIVLDSLQKSYKKIKENEIDGLIVENIEYKFLDFEVGEEINNNSVNENFINKIKNNDNRINFNTIQDNFVGVNNLIENLQNLKNVEIKKNPQEKFDEYDDIDGEPI